MTTLGFLGSINSGEMVVIAIVFLMLFGAKKLPGMARSIGKSMEEFRRAANDVRDEFMKADLDPPKALPPPEPSADATEAHPDIDGVTPPAEDPYAPTDAAIAAAYVPPEAVPGASPEAGPEGDPAASPPPESAAAAGPEPEPTIPPPLKSLAPAAPPIEAAAVPPAPDHPATTPPPAAPEPKDGHATADGH